MHYLPPFRLYLIFSVVFFLLPNESLNIENAFHGDMDSIEKVSDLPLSKADKPTVLSGDQIDASQPVVQDAECVLEGWPVGSWITIMMRNVCLQFNDDPELIVQKMIDSIPLMMIIGIPLVAVFMQMTYLLAGRMYIEHIIFLLHAHAFYFLVAILTTFSSLLGYFYPLLSGIMEWFNIIATLYVPAYIFMAMLRVYGDSKRLTFAKVCFIMLGYGFSMLFVGAGSIFVNALAV